MGDGLALMAGAVLTLAFAPFSLFPIAIISPALLLGLWLTTAKKRAFLRGWLFGVGLFSTGVYWVFISIHTYGDTSVFLAGLITCVFITILALFPAMNGYILNRYFPYNNDSKILFAFPAIWVLLEWVRSWIFTGFPWLLLGSSQINSPLKGFAPILGVYGVSLAALLSSSLLVNTFIKIHQKNYKNAGICFFILLFIWITGGCLSFMSWTENKGSPIQVSLVQGNIEQELKWSYDQVIPTIERYQKLSNEHWDSKIIIWPENAIPLPLHDAQDFVEKMSDDAKKHHTTVITGIPAKHGTKNAYYNAVIAVGNDYGFYLKRRLVPFGEYTPYPEFLTRVMDRFNIPMSNMIVGEAPAQPLMVQGLRIATFICYEIAFPEQVLQRDGNIDMLLTVSNDAWFGHSIAQAQHLEMAQMRALELARPVLFVSNTGITAIIKPNGTVQSSVPPYQTAVLTGSVQAVSGKTLWQRYGMDPVLILTILFLVNSIRSQKKQRKKAS